MSNTKKRKLRAILFADIVGYTSLMQKDEAHASTLLQKFRNTLNEKVTQHSGEVINNYGDGCLCTFESAVDAMTCAKEVQLLFRKEPIVPVRIGLHSGDVFFEDDNVFGDSVNIASRIESLGVAGAILFSKQIKRHISNQKEFEVQSLGEFDFKNVEKTMEVFGLANEGLIIPSQNELASKRKPKKNNKIILLIGLLTFLGLVAWYFSFQNKNDLISSSSTATIDKSIAVLPFEDFSANKDQEYLGDGISEEILNALTQLKDLKVIGRTSSFSFKNKDIPIAEIAKQLNVGTILEGSVRKDRNKIRITAQLINARDESHIWSETYDRNLDEIFAIQEEISLKIVEKLKVSLLNEKNQKLVKEKTKSEEAYDKFLKGKVLIKNKPTDPKVANYALEAIKLDPYFIEAYLLLAEAKAWIAWGEIQAPKPAFAKAIQLLELGKNLNPEHSSILEFSFNLWHQWNWEKIKIDIESKKYISLPNYEQEVANYYSIIGLHEQAEQYFKVAKQKDPLNKIILDDRAQDLFRARNYNELLNLIEQSIPNYPKGGFHYRKADIYFFKGNYQEAYDALSEAKNIFYDQTNFPLRYESLNIACLVKLGQQDLAQEKFDQLVGKRKRVFVDPFILAFASYFLGDKEEALDYLELAYEMRSTYLVEAKVSPYFDAFRAEPRFQEILDKMDFPKF